MGCRRSQSMFHIHLMAFAPFVVPAVSFSHGSQAPGGWHLVEHWGPLWRGQYSLLPDAAAFDPPLVLSSVLHCWYLFCHAAFWAVESGPGLCFEMCAGADFRAASCALPAFHHSTTRCAGTCLHPLSHFAISWCFRCFSHLGAQLHCASRGGFLSSLSRAPPQWWLSMGSSGGSGNAAGLEAAHPVAAAPTLQRPRLPRRRLQPDLLLRASSILQMR